MDGFLTTHLERTFYKHESELIREYLGAPDDIIDCPTEAQRVLFGPTRRRVPKMMDLTNPILLGPVQNQEHYMQGIVARRNNFAEPILEFLEAAYKDFGELTGRHYGLITRVQDATTPTPSSSRSVRPRRTSKPPSTTCAQTRNVERRLDPRQRHSPLPRGGRCCSAQGQEERHHPGAHRRSAVAATTRWAATFAPRSPRRFRRGTPARKACPRSRSTKCRASTRGTYGLGSRDFRPEHIIGAYEFATAGRARKDGKTAADGVNFIVLGIDHPYAVIGDETPSLLPEGAVAVRFHSIGGWGAITTGKNLGAILGDLNDLLYERDGLVDD